MRRSGKLLLTALIVALVVALLGVLGWRLARTQEAKGLGARANAGARPAAPDFTLPRLGEEGELTLSSLRGKVVVLNFWASWCPPCKEEAPVLEDAWQRYADRGVVVLGVDVNDLSSAAAEFVEEYGITYPNVHDGKGSTLGDYGIPALPETMFIDAEGRIVSYVPEAVTANDLAEHVERALG